jgi:hypothetical protein
MFQLLSPVTMQNHPQAIGQAKHAETEDEVTLLKP